MAGWVIYQTTSRVLLNVCHRQFSCKWLFHFLGCVCISLEKELGIDFGSLYGYRHWSRRNTASFAKVNAKIHIKINWGERGRVWHVTSHNLKSHFADIHKCEKVSELSFKLFFGAQDGLNSFSLNFCSHLFACFLHLEKKTFCRCAMSLISCVCFFMEIIPIWGQRVLVKNVILVISNCIRKGWGRGTMVFFLWTTVSF